jgi:type I restriction-modification system DNA methylase subunit
MDQAGKIEQLHSLVSLFSSNIAQYKGSQYDEANTRTDFIDKFFALLDWDISNNQAFSETYREVVREDKVKIDGSQKAPDYSFRIGGYRKFFVEAKKPAVNIKDAAEPAYQVRRYAYTAKLPLSILTNFEEFAVYDTRIKPDKNDKVGKERIFYCTYDQYEQHFDFICNTFSKNAILKGSFDKYIEEFKNKKGTSEVDIELLALIEEWRVELAKNIAKNNSALSVYNLNTAVQRIIDRIVFLRIAEDKGIEDENLLLSVAKTANVYEKLILLFTKANVKYNSGLFTGVDWINDIHIDDKVLSNIIVNLYYPECPYEFSVLPVEILGSIYERFLGKTIRFRAIKGDIHTAIIEEKPEVKKAGGVYYTPQYIVDYIVKNTVGEKIKNKTPDEISSIKICDPACGSGSFLVGVYQYLLNYHLDYYTQAKNVKSALKNAKIYEAAFQSYKLTIEEKQRILTSSLFGVDIDSQAVEVTKLSLYLKLLENEGKEAKDWLFRYSDYTLLPSLEDNIKCGNSLIAKDFYSQGNLDFTDDDRIKVNCFNWEEGFEEIFKAGGFDVVVGNPPYVRPHNIESYVKEYFWKHYVTFVAKSDMYSCFMEKGINIVKEEGVFGFIVPHTWTSLESFTSIRKYILENCAIIQLVQLPKKVFADATVETCIFVFKKQQKHKEQIINVYRVDQNSDTSSVRKFPQDEIKNAHLYNFQLYGRDAGQKIIEKIKTAGIPLDNYIKLVYGFKTADDEKFISQKKISKDYKLFIRSADIFRYRHNVPNEYVWYVPDVMIKNRKSARPGEIDRFLSEKIIVARMGKELIASYDSGGLFVKDAMLLLNRDTVSLKYILAILNSRLMNYYYKEYFITIDVLKNALLSLPFPILDLSIKADKTKHDRLVSLVDKMLELKQKEAAELNQQLKTMIARQIDGVDKAIDTAVYGLYNLTEDEIKVVEG